VPANPYDPQRPPRPGSHLLLRTKEGRQPVEATLEGYLPGRVKGQPLRGERAHRFILVRVAGVPIKTDTTRIHAITWKSPNRPPKKATRAEVQARRKETLQERRNGAAAGRWQRLRVRR
jgi:hypothetical protein